MGILLQLQLDKVCFAQREMERLVNDTSRIARLDEETHQARHWSAIVCALLIGVYSFMFMPDTYTATTSMYVLTDQSMSAGNLSTDLSASQMVANDVTTLLNSNRVRKATADDLGLKSLKDFEIEVTSATTSRVIELSVTGTEPELIAKVGQLYCGERCRNLPGCHEGRSGQHYRRCPCSRCAERSFAPAVRCGCVYGWFVHGGCDHRCRRHVEYQGPYCR